MRPVWGPLQCSGQPGEVCFFNINFNLTMNTITEARWQIIGNHCLLYWIICEFSPKGSPPPFPFWNHFFLNYSRIIRRRSEIKWPSCWKKSQIIPLKRWGLRRVFVFFAVLVPYLSAHVCHTEYPCLFLSKSSTGMKYSQTFKKKAILAMSFRVCFIFSKCQLKRCNNWATYNQWAKSPMKFVLFLSGKLSTFSN